MPIRLKTPTSDTPAPMSGTSAPTSGIRLKMLEPEMPVTSDTDEGEGLGDLFTPAGVLGGAALAGAGLLGARTGVLSKLARGASNLRQQSMLSGLAIPKAVVSNIGGAAIASAERRSMDPLKKLLSVQTIKDIINEYKAGAPGHIQAAGTTTGKAMHGPGRVLGAIDEATQNAFGRAGLTPEEAKRLTFQTPIEGRLGRVLDNPAMRYLIPFRRTPFNTLFEGAESFTGLDDPVRAAMLAGSGVAGAVHGAATSEEKYPMSLGIGGAAANRYALPYLLSAAIGRNLAGGKDPESVAGEALPISEYGLASGVTNPLGPFTRPGFLRVLERLLGEE